MHSNFILLFGIKYAFYEDCEKGIKEELFAKNAYFQKENFYQLKKKLNAVKIKFLLESFENISKVLKGQKYDKIYLSCLNQYIDQEYFEILWYYTLLLNSNGVMEGAYLYHSKLNIDMSYVDYWASLFPMEKVFIDYSEKSSYDVAYLYRNK